MKVIVHQVHQTSVYEGDVCLHPPAATEIFTHRQGELWLESFQPQAIFSIVLEHPDAVLNSHST